MTISQRSWRTTLVGSLIGCALAGVGLLGSAHAAPTFQVEEATIEYEYLLKLSKRQAPLTSAVNITSFATAYEAATHHRIAPPAFGPVRK